MCSDLCGVGFALDSYIDGVILAFSPEVNLSVEADRFIEEISATIYMLLKQKTLNVRRNNFWLFISPGVW